MTTSAPATQSRTSRGRRSSRPSGDDRQLAILETAEKLLEDRPLSEISVDDLAKGAGISRPTFYFYFSSKDAVVLALVDKVVQRVEHVMQQMDANPPDDPVDGWRIAISTFYEAFGAHRWVANSGSETISAKGELRDVWLSFMQKWIDQTADRIDDERARVGAPDTIPARDLATSLNLMNERSMLASYAAEQPSVERDRLVDTLTHIWVTSIYGTTP
jgi:TetR/AcrR family transcriptional regulator, ethionamide resistance regulator